MREQLQPKPRAANAFLSALLLVLGGAFAPLGSAHAAGCSVSSTGLAFGPYQPLNLPGRPPSQALTSNASISVACTGIAGGGSYTLALGPSTAGFGDRISIRYLANPIGGGDMAFNVYTNASYSTIWGDGLTGSVLGGNIPAGDSNQMLTVYGRIPASQNTLRTGSFSGTMTVTLTYNP